MDMSVYKKAYAAAEDMLDSLNKGDRKWTNTACVAIVFDEKHTISTNQACHAGLQWSGWGGVGGGALAAVSALMKPQDGNVLDEEEALMFLDWLLNRSPYSETFITKSAHEALRTKFIISDAFHPSNLMAAGQVASRRLWEYETVARVFCDLVKAGVNEDLAFYMGHCYLGNFNRAGKVSWGGCRAGHCSLSTELFGKAELLAFMQHKVVNPNATYNENCNYLGYDKLYGCKKPGELSIGSWVHQNINYNAGGVFEKVNPFPPDVGADVGKCSYEHLIESFAAFQPTLFKYIGWTE